MIGSWSIGDYYKEGAIGIAVDFLINQLQIEKKKLTFSYHIGDKKLNIPEDTETKE